MYRTTNTKITIKKFTTQYTLQNITQSHNSKLIQIAKPLELTVTHDYFK